MSELGTAEERAAKERRGPGSAHRGGAPDWTAGVGSKRTQPTSAKYSSGHACESRPVTTYTPSSSCRPGRNPTARRAGMPSDRAITVIAVANCTQYPRPDSRKSQTASLVRAGSTSVAYVKFCAERK